MSGRQLYHKYKSFLDLLEKFLSFLPRKVSEYFLEVSRNTSGKIGFGIRYILLRELTSKCGRVVAIYPGIYILNAEHLEIKDFVSIHQMCYLECYGGLKIGSNVSLSHGVSIITHEHDYTQTTLPMRDAPLLLRPVEIEDDVWIGAGARILGGVTIGKGSVVGAGAVVTKSIPPYSVAVGVPAKVILERRESIHNKAIA